MAQHFPALITLASLLLQVMTLIAVALARVKYKIAAPATTGNENFERIFRVQMNTLENLVLFLPALWLFALYVSYFWAGILGLVWLIGRGYYAISYIKSAETRSAGFAIGFLAFVVLAVGAAIGVGLRILAGT